MFKKSVVLLATMALIAGMFGTPASTLAYQSGTMSGDSKMSGDKMMMENKAADLRIALQNLLGEHVLLAGAATGAPLGGRTAEFGRAAAALDANSNDITKAIASVYGEDAGKAFGPLWKKHIGFVVTYTTALAKKDKRGADKAVKDLLAYAREFGAFLNTATKGGLPTDAVAKLVTDHIVSLKDVIDAQAAKSPNRTYAALRKAYAHMGMIAEPLAGAIAKQFPEKFPGDASSSSAGLRGALNALLAEHTYLAAAATGGALGGRTAEFQAAATALDGNSNDLTKAVASVYGADAGKAFGPLWKKHIGFVVTYTTALAKKNKAGADKAVKDLLDYSQEFGAFLNSATKGGLPTDAVAGLVKEHIVTLKGVIDAQAARQDAYPATRKAYGHMSMIADPLAGAIAKQFPDKFK